jgi:hypothetical protein
MVTSETSPKEPESILAAMIAACRSKANRGISVRSLGQRSNNTNYLAAVGSAGLIRPLSLANAPPFVLIGVGVQHLRERER